MIKLLLNPSFQLGLGEDCAVLVSEMGYRELPMAFLPLLERLQSPTDIDEIPVAEQPLLVELARQKLVVNASLRELPTPMATYWLARQYSLRFVEAQLALGLQFIGPLAASYGGRFASRYPECGVGSASRALQVHVTDDLLAPGMPDYDGAPLVFVKVGGIKQSIGPVLSPGFRLADLQRKIKRPVDANLSIQAPVGLQEAADGILLNELYHLRVQGGNHFAANHVIEWDMARMEKRLWKVK